MNIRLKLDADRLTLDDLIAIEDAGQMKARQLRDLLARFVTNDAGEYLALEDARREVGRLTLAELQAAIAQLGESIRTLSERAIPPEIGAGS